uniref:hypothetical protein n=1 Tax=Actinoplanes aureus TaxID=2792083 RepID=UPI0035A192E5
MTSNVSPPKKTEGDGRRLSPEQAAAAAMVAEAKARGLELTGRNGLLKLFTKNVLEAALNEEMTEHLGHGKNQAEPGRESMRCFYNCQVLLAARSAPCRVRKSCLLM